jgi:hypothetical protein
MSDYSSQPVEDFLSIETTNKLKRIGGRPKYENSMSGKTDKVKVLNDQGYVPKIDITWTNKKLRGDKWEEKLEVGLVDAKCIAMVIDSAEVLVQEEFERRANSYDFDAKKIKSDRETSERQASQLARKRADWENLRADFGSSSVRHVI